VKRKEFDGVLRRKEESKTTGEAASLMGKQSLSGTGSLFRALFLIGRWNDDRCFQWQLGGPVANCDLVILADLSCS
jgi:hypothetical protein